MTNSNNIYSTPIFDQINFYVNTICCGKCIGFTMTYAIFFSVCELFTRNSVSIFEFNNFSERILDLVGPFRIPGHFRCSFLNNPGKRNILRKQLFHYSRYFCFVVTQLKITRPEILTYYLYYYFLNVVQFSKQSRYVLAIIHFQVFT